MPQRKSKTRLVDGILIGLGLVFFIFGFYTWQSFNSLSGTLITLLERQGHTIPASVSVKFRQLTLIYMLITGIGGLLAIIGAANEVASFFEVK